MLHVHHPTLRLAGLQVFHVHAEVTATRQIKAAHPAAMVILVTDYDEAALREAARNAGACGYVLKENLFEVDRLLEAYRDS